MFFYYKKELIKQGKLFCLYQARTKLTEEEIRKINENQPGLLVDYAIYEGDVALSDYPMLDGENVRVATSRELFDLGIAELEDGEYFVGDDLVTIERPSWQYKWNANNNAWEIDETKLRNGEYIGNGNIIKVEYDKDLNYVKPLWDKVNHIWTEGASEIEIAKSNLEKIEKLNNYLDCEEMKVNGVFEDYKSYRNELVEFASRSVMSLVKKPEPSFNLQAWLNGKNIILK